MFTGWALLNKRERNRNRCRLRRVLIQSTEMFTERRYSLLSGLTWRREGGKKEEEKRGGGGGEERSRKDYFVLLTTCVSCCSARQKGKIYWQTKRQNLRANKKAKSTGKQKGKIYGQTNLQTKTNPLENFEDGIN